MWFGRNAHHILLFSNYSRANKIQIANTFLFSLFFFVHCRCSFTIISGVWVSVYFSYSSCGLRLNINWLPSNREHFRFIILATQWTACCHQDLHIIACLLRLTDQLLKCQDLANLCSFHYFCHHNWEKITFFSTEFPGKTNNFSVILVHIPNWNFATKITFIWNLTIIFTSFF